MWWIAGVCAICLLLCLPFFLHYKKNLRFKLAAAFKVCGTLCAASFALIAAIRLDSRCWICFAALILHATADYFLEFSLYIGAGFFLAGHICYIAFFTSIFPPTAVHLICAVCLLATKGHPKRQAANVHQFIISPIEAHSKKPDEARDKIVALMGDLPRVELFARQTPPGWDVWGNEVESTVPGFWSRWPEDGGKEDESCRM